jgi:hypothetical protein
MCIAPDKSLCLTKLKNEQNLLSQTLLIFSVQPDKHAMRGVHGLVSWLCAHCISAGLPNYSAISVVVGSGEFCCFRLKRYALLAIMKEDELCLLSAIMNYTSPF